MTDDPYVSGDAGLVTGPNSQGPQSEDWPGIRRPGFVGVGMPMALILHYCYGVGVGDELDGPTYLLGGFSALLAVYAHVLRARNIGAPAASGFFVLVPVAGLLQSIAWSVLPQGYWLDRRLDRRAKLIFAGFVVLSIVAWVNL